MKGLKGLGWGIAGLLAGQAMGLFASSPSLKRKLGKAQGTDKAKVVLDELVQFNKGLIESIDLNKMRDDVAFRIEHLQEDVTKLTTEWSELSKEKIQLWIDHLKSTIDTLKSDVEQYTKDLDSKHHLTDKLETLKTHIKDLQGKLTDESTEK